MPKTGAALHSSASCFWDNKTDGKFIFQDQYNFFFLLVKNYLGFIIILRELYGSLGKQMFELYCQRVRSSLLKNINRIIV